MLLRLRRSLTPGSSYVVKLLLEKRIVIVEARVVRLSHGVSEGLDGQGEPECFVALQFPSPRATLGAFEATLTPESLTVVARPETTC